MRFILVRALLGLFLAFPFAESADAQSCEKIASARKTLVRVSDQLGQEIGQLEPCSAAQIEKAEKRYTVLDSIIKASDYLIETCGYKLKPEGRKEVVLLRAKLADQKTFCAFMHAMDESMPDADEYPDEDPDEW